MTAISESEIIGNRKKYRDYVVIVANNQLRDKWNDAISSTENAHEFEKDLVVVPGYEHTYHHYLREKVQNKIRLFVGQRVVASRTIVGPPGINIPKVTSTFFPSFFDLES